MIIGRFHTEANTFRLHLCTHERCTLPTCSSKQAQVTKYHHGNSNVQSLQR